MSSAYNIYLRYPFLVFRLSNRRAYFIWRIDNHNIISNLIIASTFPKNFHFDIWFYFISKRVERNLKKMHETRRWFWITSVHIYFPSSSTKHSNYACLIPFSEIHLFKVKRAFMEPHYLLLVTIMYCNALLTFEYIFILTSIYDDIYQYFAILCGNFLLLYPREWRNRLKLWPIIIFIQENYVNSILRKYKISKTCFEWSMKY